MAATIRCGIIGCGVIAPLHIKCLQKQADVEVVWVCDKVKSKAQALAERFNLPQVTTAYQDVLQDQQLDCIHICTDHASHAPIAVAALEHGKHVLCEKALTAGKDGLDAMVQAHARHPDRVFGAVFQHRFDPVYQELKRRIDGGDFGTLLTGSVQLHCLRTEKYYESAAWRGTWAEEGGAVLINQAIHFVDTLVWTMGGVAAVAGAYTNRTHQDVMETEDTVTASLRFRNGALGSLEATCSSNLSWESVIAVHGSAGAVEIRDGEPTKVVFADDALQAEIRAAFSACRKDENECEAKDYYGPSHSTQIADFIKAVRTGRQPFVTGQSARHTVDVVLAVYQSSKQDRWIHL